jgi:hypothetical protein
MLLLPLVNAVGNPCFSKLPRHAYALENTPVNAPA